MPSWSFVYQYAIGGAFFVACTYLAVRARAIELDKPSGVGALRMLIVGLLLYVVGHAFSVFVMPRL